MDYDLVIVGGVLAGSSMGAAMAEKGVRVLIIEREIDFATEFAGKACFPGVWPRRGNSGFTSR